MKSLKDICRQVLTTSLSHRRIAHLQGVAPGTVSRYWNVLTEKKLDWAAISELDDLALDRLLNTGRSLLLKEFVEPDWNHVDREMRKAGVTIRLLHEEYVEGLASGDMSETEFRRRYDKHRRAHGLVMRQIHPPGQSLFIDYSGKRPSITDPVTGESTPVELFVGVMGASRKTFVYATPSQQLPDFIEAHVTAAQFFGGVTTFWVPDNLKSAVVKRSKNEGALINATYSDCARHYNCEVMPARPRKPKDKATVEVGVQVAQRWILARLRNRVFFSVAELNAAIAELLAKLNDRPMRTCAGKSRNELFEELDRPALKPLPPHPYEFADWQINVRVGQDYHIAYDGHYYSVPFHLVNSKVNVRASHRQISVVLRGRQVASHPRSTDVGGVSTLPQHRPAAHQAFAEGKPAALVAWVKTQGGAIHQFFQLHMEKHRQPTLSARACQGLQRLAQQYGVERLEAACARAAGLHATSVSSLDSMLRCNLENAPLPIRQAANDEPLPAHDNVRGADYFNQSNEGE